MTSEYLPIAWRYFDFITEVNEDLGDLIEDLQTINKNRLQLSINRYGIIKTRQDFLQFMYKIEQQSSERVKLKKSKYYDDINVKIVQ